MKLFLLVFALSFSTTLPLPGQESDLAGRLQRTLDAAASEGQFAGGFLALSVGGKETIITAGYRNVDQQKPFERKTLTRTASIAKPMTAVAVLQLYELGKLDLDAPISTYLPDYPRRHADRITTRHLLQHSSGIGAYASAKEMKSTHEYGDLASAAAVFSDRDLVDEPGKAEHYTTYGYVVLGMVIEAVSGQTYEQYLRDHVWAPADMQATGVEHATVTYPNKSCLYRKKNNGKIRKADTNNLSNRVPGGGLHSTAGDLLKFGRAILHHELIGETTTELMLTAPGLPYEGNPYGMGWFLYGEHPDLGAVYGHTASQTGSSGVLLIIPEKDAVIVSLNNTMNTVDYTFGLALAIYPFLAEQTE